MFFQDILCVSIPQPKRKQADRTGRRRPGAPNCPTCPGQVGPPALLSRPLLQGQIENDSRFLHPPTTHAAGDMMSVHCVSQPEADSKWMVAPRVWGSLPNTAAESTPEQQPSAWISPGLAISFFPSFFNLSLSQACFSSLLVSLSPLPACCLSHFFTPGLFGFPLHRSLFFYA